MITVSGETGGGNLKTVKFTVPGNFWATGQTNPFTILGASKNHYHIPLSLTYYYSGGATQVPTAELFIGSKEMYSLNRHWSRIIDPFKSLTSSTGITGIYQCLADQNTAAYCYTETIDDTQNDLYLFTSTDDPLTDIGNVKMELVYYTYKP